MLARITQEQELPSPNSKGREQLFCALSALAFLAFVKALYDEKYLTVDTTTEVQQTFHFSEVTLQMILRPGYEKLRQLIQTAFRKENIMLAEYNWRSDLDVICEKGSAQTAFVYVGTDEAYLSLVLLKWLILKMDIQQLLKHLQKTLSWITQKRWSN